MADTTFPTIRQILAEPRMAMSKEERFGKDRITARVGHAGTVRIPMAEMLTLAEALKKYAGTPVYDDVAYEIGQSGGSTTHIGIGKLATAIAAYDKDAKGKTAAAKEG